MGRIEDALRKMEAERGRRPDTAKPGLERALRQTQRSLFQRVALEDLSNDLQVDVDALRRWGSVPMLGNDELAKREYGQVKRPIVAHATGRSSSPLRDSANVVLVASAVPGEGKSITAINLALSIAREKDLSAILIDADMTKPDLTRALRLSTAPGLSNLVSSDEVQIGDVLWRTSLSRFFFMPAGNQRAGATELYGSQRMADVVEYFVRELPEAIVVIDSPPLLVTNESRVLASLVGQVVFVVRADSTPRHRVTEAIELLDPEKPVGLVLNGARASEMAYYPGVYSAALDDQEAAIGKAGQQETA